MQPARGRDFVRVVAELAGRVGVDLDVKRQPSPAARRSALLHDVLVLARRELRSDRGNAARTYLLETRRFPASAIESEPIGVVPPADDLRRALTTAGYRAEEIDASNVLADSRWPGRLVGAWRDTHGHAETLWTRSIDPAEPAATRYLYLRGAARTNLPPYGLSDVTLRGSDGAHVVLVEGLLDAHHLRARGVANVVALGGTATQTGLFDRLGERGVDEVTLMLDADQAGHDATCRAIDNAVRAQHCPNITVARLDPTVANDPDGYLHAGRLDELRAAVDTRTCAIGWRTETLLTQQPGRPARHRAAGEWLGNLNPRWSIEQDRAVTVVAASLNADVDATRRAFRARYWAAATPARASSR